MNKILLSMLAAIIVLVTACVILCKVVHSQRKELNEKKNTIESLITGIEQIRNDSTLQAYQIGQLTLDAEEFSKYYEETAETIEKLNLKLKNVQATSRQELLVNAVVKAPLTTKDTIIVKDTIKEVTKVEQFKYDNSYLHLHGNIYQDSVQVVAEMPITITQIISRVPKHKFLWWSWGTKAIKQTITTNNPYAKLNYADYIELKH